MKVKKFTKRAVEVAIIAGMLSIVACGEKEDQQISWSGIETERVVRGDSIDLMQGIMATDTKDGDISSKVEIVDDGGFSTHLADGYTVTYSVTNSRGTTQTVTKDFVTEVAHNVANGDFSLNNYSWTLDVPGGKAEWTVEQEQAVVSVTDPGTAWWSIQLYQSGTILKEGTTYKLSFDASSPEGRTIAAGYEDIPNGYSMLNPGFQIMQLKEQMQTYEVYFTASADCENTKVVIYLGNMDASVDELANAKVYIDNVKIEKIPVSHQVTFSGIEDLSIVAGQEFSLTDGVEAVSTYEMRGYVPENISAAGDYYVTYFAQNTDGTVSFANRKISVKLPKDFEYQVVNGKLSYGFMGWTKDVNQTAGKGEADFFDNEDGTVSVKVVNPSDAGWHIQLYQTASTIRENETYVIHLRAKADTKRMLTLEVCDPNNGFADVTGLGSTGVLTFELDTEYRDYEFEFTAAETLSGIKLAALLGNVDGFVPAGSVVTIDEFDLYKYAPFNEELNGAEDGSCPYWVYDNITGSYTTEGLLEVDFSSGAGMDPWNNQLYQNSGFALESGHIYEVRVKMMSDIDRVIRAWVEDAANGYSAIATDDRTILNLKAGEWGELVYAIEVTDELATQNAKYAVMFGDGSATKAHKVWVDYFHVEDITVE